MNGEIKLHEKHHTKHTTIKKLLRLQKKQIAHQHIHNDVQQASIANKVEAHNCCLRWKHICIISVEQTGPIVLLW